MLWQRLAMILFLVIFPYSQAESPLPPSLWKACRRLLYYRPVVPQVPRHRYIVQHNTWVMLSTGAESDCAGYHIVVYHSSRTSWWHPSGTDQGVDELSYLLSRGERHRCRSALSRVSACAQHQSVSSKPWRHQYRSQPLGSRVQYMCRQSQRLLHNSSSSLVSDYSNLKPFGISLLNSRIPLYSFRLKVLPAIRAMFHGEPKLITYADNIIICSQPNLVLVVTGFFLTSLVVGYLPGTNNCLGWCCIHCMVIKVFVRIPVILQHELHLVVKLPLP